MARLIPIAVFSFMAICYGILLTIVAPFMLGALAQAMWHHFMQGWNW